MYSEPSVKVQYELLVKNSSEKQACRQDVFIHYYLSLSHYPMAGSNALV